MRLVAVLTWHCVCFCLTEQLGFDTLHELPLCGSSGLVYSLSHQAYEREACCWHWLHPPLPAPRCVGHSPCSKAGSGDCIFALAEQVPVTVSSSERGFLPRQEPFMPSSFDFSSTWRNKPSSLPVVTPRWRFLPVFHALCLNSSKVLLSGGLPGALFQCFPSL